MAAAPAWRIFVHDHRPAQWRGRFSRIRRNRQGWSLLVDIRIWDYRLIGRRKDIAGEGLARRVSVGIRKCHTRLSSLEALAGARYRWDETWGIWGNVLYCPRHRLRSGVLHSGIFVDSITFELSTSKTDICGHALENRG